jgi:DNA-binding transcriptional LysR family regulator
MTFKQLEALYWIAQLGGFAAAADRLHTTQSAISKRVRELEHLFETELFDRSLRIARLTDKGQEMFVLAKKLLEDRDAAVERLSSPQTLHRRLRIGVTELSAMTWLPRLVWSLREAYPRVVIEPAVESSVSLAEGLLQDKLDLIIVPDAFNDPRLLASTLGSLDSAWMCHPDFPIRRGAITLKELGRHPLLLQGASSGSGRIHGAWLKSNGLVLADTIVADNLMALLSLTVSGLGIGCLPTECVRPMVRANMLRLLNVTPEMPTINYVALRHDDGRSQVVTDAVEVAKRCFDFSQTFQVHHRPPLGPHTAARRHRQ